jgi:hypothetical protein
MTLRRLLIGTTMVFGLSAWAWTRPGEVPQARANPAPPTYAVDRADAAEGGNHDEAVARFRSNQPTHWRHVMIGRK